MSQPDSGIAGNTPQQINRLLCHQLSQFVTWGQAHRDLIAVHPDLAQLLQTASTALRSGIPESITSQRQATNSFPDSETLVSDTVSGLATTKEDGLIRIVIASSRPIIRESLRNLLTLEEDFRVVAEAGDGKEVVEMLEEHQPDFLVLDLKMLSLDGLTVLETLRNSRIKTKVVLTASNRNQFIQAMKSKTRSVVRELKAEELLIQNIRMVHAWGTWRDPNKMLAGPQHLTSLSESVLVGERLTIREAEIIGLVAQGFKNQEMAEKLFINLQTVKNHLHNIFGKLGISNRVELACYANRKYLCALASR